MSTNVNYIEWFITPFRADRWYAIWRPALDRALAFGATSSYMTRDVDDPLHFRQVSTWDDKADFERYWASDEISALRQEAMTYYAKPLIPGWHVLTADVGVDAGDPAGAAAPAAAE